MGRWATTATRQSLWKLSLDRATILPEGQALCLFPQDVAASPTGVEADAADWAKLRHQISFNEDLLMLASEKKGKRVF